MNFEERFWSKVDKTPGHGPWGDCWLWTGKLHGRHKHLQGRFRLDGFLELAHRVAWFITYGPIPRGKQVLHSCDVGYCMNPSHVFIGNHLANMEDMARKGRRKGILCGKDHPSQRRVSISHTP